MSISVVYWSGTGNTQAMAEAVVEGIKAAGQEAAICRRIGISCFRKEDSFVWFLWMGRRRMDERLGRSHEKCRSSVDS